MNTAKILEQNSEIVLPKDKPYLLTQSSKRYSDDLINITYRSPRTKDDQTTFVVATTSLSTSNLNSLTIEELDGFCYLVNSKKGLSDSVRLNVESAEIGYSIIKSILDLSDDEKDGRPKGRLIKEVSFLKQAQKYIDYVESISPALLTASITILCLTASFWFLTY